MSCIHPMFGVPTGNLTASGKRQYRIVPNTSFSDILQFNSFLKKHPDAIVIPCGRCIECRLDYSRRWADRMMLELQTSKKAIFLTLTYDDAHITPCQFEEVVPDFCVYYPRRKYDIISENGTLLVPKYYTLVKRDYQLFMKRLRRAFPDIKFRFYLGAEYGDKTLRPHAHLILYGLSIDDFLTCSRGVLCRECSVSEDYYCKTCLSSLVKVPCGRSELGDDYFTSPLLRKIWNNGNILFSDVSWKTCAYVARYVTKKFHGDYAVDYQIRNCLPEFSLMSRRPGIGAQYFFDHPECVDFNSISISTPDGGKNIAIPSYFLRLLDLSDSEKCDMIKERRKVCSVESMKLKLDNTTLSHIDYLDMREQKKLDSVKRLKRGSV